MHRSFHRPQGLPVLVMFSFMAIIGNLAWSAAYPDGIEWDKEVGRWSRERAQAWYETQPWLVGANFVPSTASNQLEMWQEATFDPETIDRELGWAAAAGFNVMRVYLHDMAWQADPGGFEKRVDEYLGIANRHGISTMLVLFDSVWNPYPELGPQPEPIPGVHNSRWVQGPHLDIQKDPARYEELEPYVTAMLTRFKEDPRVLAWDLFNEPGNPVPQYDEGWTQPDKERAHLALLPRVFTWAREVGPAQPLTAGVWITVGHRTDPVNPLDKLMLEQSDIITFHSYGRLEAAQTAVEWLQQAGRPIICTEYMARSAGSTFQAILPYFKQENVGAIHWGLVSGRSQTIYPWSSWGRPDAGEPDPWFHDIFHRDGTAYRADEMALIRELTGRPEAAPEALACQVNEQGRYVEVSAGGGPVLRYHHGTTAVPEGIDPAFERGGYVSALYGLAGEMLTEDFPLDHVHHRAVNWTWATTSWKGEVRDMYAVRNPHAGGPIIGGLWQRPAGEPRCIADDSAVVIEAESRWMWDDTEAIVDEWVRIEVRQPAPARRTIDFTIRLVPRVDGLEFAGRLEQGYSGFNIRMARGEGQRIQLHNDGPQAVPRRSYAVYSARFEGGPDRSGVAILQHPSNPAYPGDWLEYPELNFFQPAYPGKQLVPMPKDEPILLRYQLIVHRGELTQEELAERWDRYAASSAGGQASATP